MTTRLEQLKKLVELDYTNAEIAAVLGVSERTVIRWKPKAGIEKRDQSPLPDSVRKEIRRLSAEEGWPTEEIVETLGVSPEAVFRWSVRGPGKEWAAIAAVLAVKYRTLWNELREKR